MLAAAASLPVQAQTKKLRQAIVLQMAEGDGSNSAAVAWHPLQRKYYTAMAGNAIYAMSCFDERGKVLQENVDAENDYRGIWYNNVAKRLEFNCYDSGGIGHLVLSKTGKIDSKPVDFSGMNQPSEQSVGVYYPPGNQIIYLNGNTYEVEKYSARTGLFTSALTTIRAGCRTQQEADDMDADTEAARWESRNKSTVQYTGIPKAELAILNVDDRTIELYDQKTGLLSKMSFSLPEKITLQFNFNFSYTNGTWWIFDKENRRWVGFR